MLLRYPEIQHLDLSVGSDLDVGRLQIAMHNPLFVRRFQCADNLFRNRYGLVDRNRASHNPVGKRHSGRQFHYQEVLSAGFLESMNRRNVGMIQRGEYARLSLQEGQPLAVVRDRLGQKFDRHASPQLQIRRLINLTHTP